MIRFYYQAGSAETSRALTDDIRAALQSGAEVLLLVPEQETVAVERRMLGILPPSSQLSFEVVNFSRLANRTFRTLGGHRFHTATSPVRALLMWRALTDLSPLLTHYGRYAKEPRLCDMMLETAARCRAHRIKAEDLLLAAERLEKSDALHEKLTDIGTVLGAFERSLAASFDNGDDELDRLAALLFEKGHDLFANTHIFVDSFHDFTGQEHAILRALARSAASLSFTFPLSGAGDEGLHLEAATRTHRLLRRMADELSLPVEIRRVEHQKPDCAMAYVAQNLFRMDAMPAPLAMLGDGSVTLTRADSPFAEAEAAVAKIHELLRGGCRYRDITIVTRDANAWCGILDAALAREGIPFFLSEKTDVTVRPLVKTILLALRVHNNAWRDQDVISYAKTGLCGATADDVNCFEEYVNLWHPRGKNAYAAPFTKNPDGFGAARSARGERIGEGANRAREIIYASLDAFFTSLDEAQNATDMCRAVYDYLQKLDVPSRLSQSAADMLAKGNRREAEELSRLYTVTVEALESISRALGDQKLNTAEFYDALSLVFARTDIGTIPTSTDEVTVGSAVTLRADHPRHVLILGLCEGQFPLAVTERGLLSDSERERLAALDLSLPGGKPTEASNELFFLSRAFGAPSESLHLFYSAHTASGGTAMPSIAVTRAQKLLGGKKPTVFEEQDPLDSLYTTAALLDRLCDLEGEKREAAVALLRELEVPAAESISRPVADPLAKISVDLATDIVKHSHLSPTGLSDFTDCHFAYYCRRVLALREKKSSIPSFADSGTYIHYVLEQAIERAKREQKELAAFSKTELDSLVSEIANAYHDEILPARDLTPRTEALFSRLTQIARLVVYSLAAEFADSDFRVAKTEFDIGTAGTPATLTLTGGERISLAGKADRLDVWQAPSGNTYLRVVDYKTGEMNFSPADVAKGRSLQMPLYLMTLCEKPNPSLNRLLGLPDETKLLPAGVTYFSSKLKSENTPSQKMRESVEKDMSESLVRSGVILSNEEVLNAASKKHDPAIVGEPDGKMRLDGAEFDAMFKDLRAALVKITEEMKSGVAAAIPDGDAKRSPCDYCPFAAVCRVACKGKKGGA